MKHNILFMGNRALIGNVKHASHMTVREDTFVVLRGCGAVR